VAFPSGESFDVGEEKYTTRRKGSARAVGTRAEAKNSSRAKKSSVKGGEGWALSKDDDSRMKELVFDHRVGERNFSEERGDAQQKLLANEERSRGGHLCSSLRRGDVSPQERRDPLRKG